LELPDKREAVLAADEMTGAYFAFVQINALRT
jgi:hypothetical protein